MNELNRFVNRIHHQDCMAGMALLPKASIDLVLVDPPYGTTQNKWDTVLPLDTMWKRIWHVAKPNAAIVFTASQPFTSMLVMSQPKHFRYSMIWDKKNTTGFLNAKRMPLRRHEDILVFYKQPPTYFPQMKVRGAPRKKGGADRTNRGCYGEYQNTNTFNNTYYPTSIVEISNADKKNIVHPTQKPIDLFAYLIRTFSNPGDIVLDFCMGSGTTAMACLETNRNFIGYEVSAEYHAMANQRIEAWKAQQELQNSPKVETEGS